MTPDFVEQELGGNIDNIVPTRGYQMMPMVGLGGSAGSITALQEFFKAMPADSGMVFVVILHLSPSHHSTMPALLGRSTTMPVAEAQDGQRVEPDHVYVIPPGKYLATTDGHLRLSDLAHERGKRAAVDLFFRSLADTHGPHASAVVLSGADGDGAIGIKRIKERGGLTIAQDPDEAEHASMPRTSIETGMVDWVLHAAQIPHRLVEYARSEFQVRLPPEEGPQPAQAPRHTSDEGETALREVLVFLRTRTGRDFSYYKRATILRRIGRRMQVNGVDDLPAYLGFLRTHPGESGALLQDMLIPVTNFFRDRECFDALEQEIPRLFEHKKPGQPVRVWVPACATREEAYSVAMLLLEHASKLDSPPALQIFGCDLGEEAIQEARVGVYPAAITADVSEERLRRFFVKDHHGYRVRREVREIVLFATHDLLKDAPFSRLDLVTCRNLLIYLNREAQNHALDIFHFALRPGGRLFLGSSESVDEGSLLFRVLDKKHRLYAALPTARVSLPVPTGPSTPLRVMETQKQVAVPTVVHGRNFLQEVTFRQSSSPAYDRATVAELHFKLVERYAPPSVVINADHEIIHFSEHAGRFLQFVGGEPTNNLLRLVHPMLRIELRAALFRAAESNAQVQIFHAPVELEGQECMVDIRVSQAPEIAPGFLLVVFDERPRGTGEPPVEGRAAPTPLEPTALQIERELAHVRNQLRDTVEQYEASGEEMKASNEELRAMNEELRSATEKLETSREELQSTNEELTTVNVDMKSKVDELAHANSDLQNLMASTSIAIVFLDRALTITRYTPSAVELFNLIPGDVGRPLGDLRHQLDYPELLTDTGSVLRNLQPVEREVRGGDRWFLSRFQPYRTTEDHIGGVVLTFVDVTARKHAESDLADDLQNTERLRKVGERLVPEGNMQALFDEILDAAIAITRSDAGMVQLFDPASRELHPLATRGFTPELGERFKRVAAGVGSSCAEALESGRRATVNFERGPGQIEPGSVRCLQLEAGLHTAQSTPLVARSGQLIGMISTHWREFSQPSERELCLLDLLVRQAADAIERRQADQALHQQMDELTRFNAVAVGRETRMIELKKEVNALSTQLGEEPRYPLEFDRTEDGK